MAERVSSAGPDYLNGIKDVKRRADCSVPTIYKAIREGKLRAVKVGRSTRIRESDLQAWFNSLPAFPSRVGGAQ